MGNRKVFKYYTSIWPPLHQGVLHYHQLPNRLQDRRLGFHLLWSKQRTPLLLHYGQMGCRIFKDVYKISLIFGQKAKYVLKGNVCSEEAQSGYQKRTGQFLKVLHVYSIDNFVAF